MSSRKRVLSSRANGARSRGPKTEEGKRRSSQNAIRHGLLARCIVLENESREAFENLLAEYLARFGPLDAVEIGMVEEMVASLWRMRRTWAMETGLLDVGLRSQPPGDEVHRIAAAFTGENTAPQLALLHRYETRLHRIFQRALHNIRLLRDVPLPNEPSFAAADSQPSQATALMAGTPDPPSEPLS